MSTTYRIALLAALCAAACACQPADDDAVGDATTADAAGDARPGDTAAAGSAAEDASDAAVTMRYDCDADTRITVFADDSARVALPDGQQVTLSRVAGSAPPVFTGDSLFFSIGDADAHLSQGDQTSELSCRPA